MVFQSQFTVRILHYTRFYIYLKAAGLILYHTLGRGRSSDVAGKRPNDVGHSHIAFTLTLKTFNFNH